MIVWQHEPMHWLKSAHFPVKHFVNINIAQMVTVKPKEILDSNSPRLQHEYPQMALYQVSILEALLMEVSWNSLWFVQQSAAAPAFKLASLM